MTYESSERDIVVKVKVWLSHSRVIRLALVTPLIATLLVTTLVAALIAALIAALVSK